MWRKLSFFSLLYFIQGAALAYVINFQKPFLSAKGVSKETIGLFTSLLLLPFIGKILLGYISDRWTVGAWGARKPYMIFGIGLFAVCYFSLSQVDPGEHFSRFAILTWFASLGLAWFDACADGWAVDVSTEGEQSSVQAAMVSGKSLGMILMSVGFGQLAADGDYSKIFLTLSVLASAVLLVITRVPYRPYERVKHEYIQGWKDVLRGFYLFFAAFGVLYTLAVYGVDGLVTLHLVEARGGTTADIGFYGMSRGLGALMGAVAYAFAQKKTGLLRAQPFAIVLVGVGCLTPLIPLPVLASGTMWGFCWGFQETAYVTLAMRFAQGHWAATLFALSMIFANVGIAFGEALGAPMVPRFGYDGVFMGFAVLAWISLVPLMGALRPFRERAS